MQNFPVSLVSDDSTQEGSTTNSQLYDLSDKSFREKMLRLLKVFK